MASARSFGCDLTHEYVNVNANYTPDMFRDQRLGEISEDILDYLSSRKADQRIFRPICWWTGPT